MARQQDTYSSEVGSMAALNCRVHRLKHSTPSRGDKTDLTYKQSMVHARSECMVSPENTELNELKLTEFN